MKKIQNILTGIIIIAVIALLGISVWIIYNQIINNQKQENISNNSSTTNEISNTIEEKNDEEENNTTVQSNNDYVGVEEEESDKQENTEKTTEEKAIELAKETWGEDDSVTFSIERKDENIYYIAVRSNAITISWYQINTETWEISEYY